MYFISLVVFLIVIGFFSGFGQDIGSLFALIDIPSLLVILLPVAIMFQTSGYGRELKKIVRLMIKPGTVFERNEYRKMLEGVNLLLKLFICDGIFALILGWIMLFKNFDFGMSIEWFGANIAVSLVPACYTLFLCMILLPIQYKLKALLIEEE